MSDFCDIVIAGAAIIDIPVVPADLSVFSRTSTPAEHIIMTSGGDAMNEALILSQLGKKVRLVTRIGCDDAGEYIKNRCISAHIDTRYFHEIQGLDTGVNVVLVDENGERRFFTNPNGSLRALQTQDITPQCLNHAKIFCLASIFVFPLIHPDDLEHIFHTAKQQGLITCADMTSPKNGETVRDLAPALHHLDYFFANFDEAKQLTGCFDPYAMADCLLQTGVKHVIIKLGADGCLIASNDIREHIPACPNTNCIDTTGAGDNFAAGFFAALLDGYSFIECARRANACAAISVESVGATTGVCNAQQVQDKYQNAYC